MQTPEFCPCCKKKFISQGSQMPAGINIAEDLNYLCAACMEDFRDYQDADREAPWVASKRVQIAGVELHCQVCQHDLFSERKAQLNTALATLFGFDAINKEAACFVCDNCGYIHWFLLQE